MYTPRSNWVLFGLYSLISIAVFIAALVSPMVRGFAYAPLRELLAPPPKPVEISLIYSTEKEDWLKEAILSFEKTNPRVAGRPIHIQTQAMGSREMVLAVLDGQQKPVLISPASSLQTTVLEDQSRGKFGQAVVEAKNAASCRPVVNSPLVLVAWKERAQALWGGAPGADIWRQIHDAAIDSQGWGRFGHPDWGYVKFGQTDPLKSNSGFMAILLMTYNYFGKTSGLTAQDILSNQDYQKWFLGLEGTISQFGESTGTYMKDIVAYGPSVYDMVAVYEASAIEQADNAVGRYGELHVYYPPATIVSDHPFCVLQADWVQPEQARAAGLFVDYLLSRSMQALAMDRYGFRPADGSIALTDAGSPWQRYAQNGLTAALPPQVELPPANVLSTLLDFWSRNVSH
ncbi:MAG TPA: substrate-binding domain-containing protein [Anaerolineaceae bacterium]|nr:substrate-binding domain-containing protein [Anaerolineaceae bacterium]